MSSVGKKVTGQKNRGSVSSVKISSRMAGDSDEDSDDGDMERNFALLSKNAAAAAAAAAAAGGLADAEEPGGEGEDSSNDEDVDEEEEAGSDSGEEEEAGSDSGEEEEAGSDSGEEEEAGSDSGEEEEAGADSGEEEEAGSDSGEEEEAGSDSGEEEEAGADSGEEEEAGSDSGEEEDEVEDDEDEEDEGDSEDSENATDANNSGELQTEEDIKKELSTMSFEDIMKLQNTVGTKVYNEIAYGTTKATQANAKKKRLNKNRPMEISSKRPAAFIRQVVPVKKTHARDPRFDDLSGEYKPEIFEKTYKFINDIKQREKEIVQKKLKKAKKGNVDKEKLEFLLKRMENQERAMKNREQQREKELDFKRKQREMAGEGLKPFFLKKSDKKKLQLADKYATLKKSGKLDSFLGKKRKRNATKDRRRLPYQQHGPEAQ